ncbi:MAG: hypothetical protein JWO82_2308 [Akkermansiaceae bacterium]|nr:hypothetical protein [Akkermansiaceae bacterium]
MTAMKRLISLCLVTVLASSCSKSHPPVAELYNSEASTPEGTNFNPIDGKVITSYIDTKAGTVATLFGNEIAAKSSASGTAYGTGAALTLVTWQQQADPNWFGARIPAGMESVETVTFSEEGAPVYERRAGPALMISGLFSDGLTKQRVEWITGLRAAVMP